MRERRAANRPRRRYDGHAQPRHGRQRCARGQAARRQVTGRVGHNLVKDLKVVAHADLKFNQTFAIPPREALPQVTIKEPQVVLLPDTNYVAAIVKVDKYDDYYLYVTRLLDPRVVPQLQATRESAQEYAALEQRRVGV